MPLVLQPTQLLQQSDGAAPEAISGRIVSVEKRYVGTNTKGPYSIQRVTIADNQSKIELVVYDRQNIPDSAKGQDLYACATQGRHGLNGLKRKDDEYKKKITPQVWVRPTAELTIGGRAFDEGATDSPPPQNQSGAPAPRQQSAPPTNSGGGSSQHAPATTDANVIKQINRAIGRVAAVYGRCLDAAFSVASDADKRHAASGGFRASPSDIKEIASGIFIAVNREIPIPGNMALPASYDKLHPAPPDPNQTANHPETPPSGNRRQPAYQS
ncbi:MAG: hypothetical protein SFV32_12515 [Opitutaceae bacterium]|nr:hypothetical protein [Opitutaceae bacterium]